MMAPMIYTEMICVFYLFRAHPSKIVIFSKLRYFRAEKGKPNCQNTWYYIFCNRTVFVFVYIKGEYKIIIRFLSKGKLKYMA